MPSGYLLFDLSVGLTTFCDHCQKRVRKYLALSSQIFSSSMHHGISISYLKELVLQRTNYRAQLRKPFVYFLPVIISIQFLSLGKLEKNTQHISQKLFSLCLTHHHTHLLLCCDSTTLQSVSMVILSLYNTRFS